MEPKTSTNVTYVYVPDGKSIKLLVGLAMKVYIALPKVHNQNSQQKTSPKKIPLCSSFQMLKASFSTSTVFLKYHAILHYVLVQVH